MKAGATEAAPSVSVAAPFCATVALYVCKPALGVVGISAFLNVPKFAAGWIEEASVSSVVLSWMANCKFGLALLADIV